MGPATAMAGQVQAAVVAAGMGLGLEEPKGITGRALGMRRQVKESTQPGGRRGKSGGLHHT